MAKRIVLWCLMQYEIAATYKNKKAATYKNRHKNELWTTASGKGMLH